MQMSNPIDVIIFRINTRGEGGGTCICRDTGMCHYVGYFLGLLPDFWVPFGLFPDFWVSFLGKI